MYISRTTIIVSQIKLQIHKLKRYLCYCVWVCWLFVGVHVPPRMWRTVDDFWSQFFPLTLTGAIEFIRLWYCATNVLPTESPQGFKWFTPFPLTELIPATTEVVGSPEKHVRQGQAGVPLPLTQFSKELRLQLCRTSISQRTHLHSILLKT